MTASPRERISLALFTLNFLIQNIDGKTAADRHALFESSTERDLVMWKDVLINKWCGPDQVITRSRGAICIFPQNRKDPIWVPTRLTREIKKKDDPVDAECPAVEDSCGGSSDDPLGGAKNSCFTPST